MINTQNNPLTEYRVTLEIDDTDRDITRLTIYKDTIARTFNSLRYIEI